MGGIKQQLDSRITARTANCISHDTVRSLGSNLSSLFDRALHKSGIPGQRGKNHLTLTSVGQYLPSVDLTH